MKQFLSVHDLVSAHTPDTQSAIDTFIDKALAHKESPLSHHEIGRHKKLGCLFMNPSMRTRLSTQIAASNLGMDVITINASQDGWALEYNADAIMNGTTVEHIMDAAPILGAYFDVLAVRCFPSLTDKQADDADSILNSFVQHCGIPIVSLESATLHPLQSFADVITISESLRQHPWPKHTPKVVLSWAPHMKAIPHSVANSFAQWMNAWGKADFVITHPPGYELNNRFTQNAVVTHNQEEALQNADFVYVKNWSAYRDYGSILSTDPSWMITNTHLRNTNNAKVMHCLPVRRNVELSAEVLDSPSSLTTLQAVNRVWAAQTVLSEILTLANQ
ncbi:MAG: acetylornithine carbamoyltransferase [Chlorobi bacterium]|nr:MAG: acetylornithine carbamoyltransferase [Bacteroidota bacterium]KXK33116.1 MAG: Ornithine carbamoyltransferase [Chlorobi bacterium OLB6]MBE2266286.1 acetylornithine carbamoyltransferase [Flavobacteriales bacterium]MBL1161796.1 acetylornithine carbamoyltransferase [Chlorobiota bacterium]MBW7853463.1 acetylornithine carbamoyltransferase [Candidatus Kapabacteria bacterium]MCC6331614.1 acetylornithine carbamoyltransferase [Ignavibacteria bacterium]